jgi:hypothetical protein
LGFLGRFLEVPDFAVARRDERRREPVSEYWDTAMRHHALSAYRTCRTSATRRDPFRLVGKIWQLILSRLLEGAEARFSDVSVLIRFAS